MTSVHQKHGAGPIDFEDIVKAAQERSFFDFILGDGGHTLEMPQRVRFAKLLKRYDRMVFGSERLRFYIEGTGHGRKFRITKDAAPTPAPPVTP